jgi:hypothetical protein
MDAFSRRTSRPHDAVWAGINRKVPSGATDTRKAEDHATERIAQAIHREGSAWPKSRRTYARVVSFHLVDWYSDLERLRAVIRKPGSCTDKGIAAIVIGFIIHAPHRIAAAFKIHGEEAIHDVFDLGIHTDGPPKTLWCLGPPMPRKKRVKRKQRAQARA